MTERTDLEQLAKIVTAMPGFTKASGMQVDLVEPGRAHLSLKRREDLLQFNGFFHGGIISGLADHAAGGAASTVLAPGKIAVTADLHVNFLAPADGDTLLARAEVVQSGKVISVVRVDVVSLRGEEERLCAIATAMLRTVDMPRG